jgi:integrase
LKSGRDEYSVTLRTEKNGGRVTCPMPDATATRVLARDGDRPCENGVSNAGDSAVAWRRALGRLCDLAGVEGHRHQFRHTFAKQLVMADVPVGTVAKLLGHRGLAVTEQHYSRWIPERQAAIHVVVRDSWTKMAGTPRA